MSSPTATPSARMTDTGRFCVALATAPERERIAALRHEVYALELGQHAANRDGRLADALDAYNINLVVRSPGALTGFVSLTPPGHPAYSIDKYFPRAALPFPVDDGLWEVRLLTVPRSHRGSEAASLLMYAALRWVESHGGARIVVIGRREVTGLYARVGLKATGQSARAGAVTYDLMTATTAELRAGAAGHGGLVERLAERTDWQLPFPFHPPAPCFHGGAFFGAIGERFDHLERRRTILNADVLDAWFPPAPGVLTALQEHLPWLLRTSPPTGCDGLVAEIAAARGVAPANLLPGGGSSDLIFRALRHWLTPASQVLILDPTYGEYAHVLEKVIGCRVDRLSLSREQGYAVDLRCLEAALADRYDLVVLVNPNSPTGRHIPRRELERLLARVPWSTRVWVDETYVEYAATAQAVAPSVGPAKDGLPISESLERFAAASENVIVCKSMSKVYALSGARAAYLCAGRHQLEALRAITPPWVVSLPAQVAAVRALQDPGYYAARYAETHVRRGELAAGLATLGWDVLPGVANFLLCHLPPDGPTAAAVVQAARCEGVFIRDAASMSPRLGTHCVRIAVKDAADNARLLRVLRPS
jgi:histidinol-phosphate/aromatic aminotransferase/cobyric acid decarboxylase-like protein/N-acyl-L-homoserine lactone synthetase